jgi:hypothetical protein
MSITHRFDRSASARTWPDADGSGDDGSDHGADAAADGLALGPETSRIVSDALAQSLLAERAIAGGAAISVFGCSVAGGAAAGNVADPFLQHATAVEAESNPMGDRGERVEEWPAIQKDALEHMKQSSVLSAARRASTAASRIGMGASPLSSAGWFTAHERGLSATSETAHRRVHAASAHAAVSPVWQTMQHSASAPFCMASNLQATFKQASEERHSDGDSDSDGGGGSDGDADEDELVVEEVRTLDSGRNRAEPGIESARAITPPPLALEWPVRNAPTSAEVAPTASTRLLRPSSSHALLAHYADQRAFLTRPLTASRSQSALARITAIDGGFVPHHAPLCSTTSLGPPSHGGRAPLTAASPEHAASVRAGASFPLAARPSALRSAATEYDEQHPFVLHVGDDRMARRVATRVKPREQQGPTSASTINIDEHDSHAGLAAHRIDVHRIADERLKSHAAEQAVLTAAVLARARSHQKMPASAPSAMAAEGHAHRQTAQVLARSSRAHANRLDAGASTLRRLETFASPW